MGLDQIIPKLSFRVKRNERLKADVKSELEKEKSLRGRDSYNQRRLLPLKSECGEGGPGFCAC